jgi:hypothetical protein
MANNKDDWEDLPVGQSVVSDGADDWEDVQTEPTELESAGRGLAQGGTLGFADEIAGAGQKVGMWLQGLMNNQDLNEESKAKYADLVSKSYGQGRDEYRAADVEAQKANPTAYGAGQLTGGIASGLAMGGTGLGAMTAQGAVQGLGSSEADLTEGDVLGAGKDVLMGGALGAGAGLAGKALSKVPVKDLTSKISKYLGKGAEKLAVNATGATASQASKFSPEAGRELLERGLVKFGDTTENIAERAAKELGESEATIGRSLSELDKQGVTVSNEKIVREIEDQINTLKSDPSQADLVRKLQSTLNDITMSGEQAVPISQAEQIKRGFQRKVNWNTPETNPLNAKVSDVYKEGVEAAALEADPALAKQFTEAKKTYGLISPIEEAAQRRALAQNQTPFGGFGDILAGGFGSVAGIPGALAGVAAKRVIAPRIASSAAVVTDTASKALAKLVEKTPESFGKYASILKTAALKGGNSLAVADYVLSSKDPEYKKLKDAAMTAPTGKPVPLQTKNSQFVKASPQEFQNLAELADSRGHSSLAEVLTNSAEKDLAGKKASLFTILQNPKLRQEYNDVTGESEGEEE